MSKLVIFKVGEGSFQQGFFVEMQIAADHPHALRYPFVTLQGKLPPSPLLDTTYQNYCQSYRTLNPEMRLGEPPAQVTHISSTMGRQQCQQQAASLKKHLKNWHDSEEFRKIREPQSHTTQRESLATTLGYFIFWWSQF